MKTGSEIPAQVIFAREIEMTGVIVLILVVVVYPSVRHWGNRGWIALLFILPLAAIWWFAYIYIAETVR
jgi:hypothetical protein